MLYPEDRIAREANSTFILNLAESVAIVILIIMLVMGFRAGVLIGSSLLFSIGGTLLLMQFLGEGLNRTSLAGFIIAMGMLVDNAIVVTDNAQQAMLRGAARRTAVVEGANAPRWSLLGATLIAIFSFLPLYLAPSSVAEIVKPLFVVLALSLLLSWVLALTQTPLFGNFMLKVKPVAGDPYDTRFYRAFDRLLAALLRWRWAVAATVVALFVLSLAVMGLMPQNFFPSLDKPYFRADVLLPEGYNIRDTERNLRAMEEWLRAQPEVKTVSMTLGSTPPRYYLASSSISLRPQFGNILVELHDKRQTEEVENRFNAYVTANFPDVGCARRSSSSPVPDAAIEFGFIGDDVDTLRRADAARRRGDVAYPGTVNIRNGWGNRVPMWQPVYSQMKGQRIGVTRSQMAQGITIATQGYRLGEYREGDQFMPILLKDENIGSYNLTNLQALPIFNPSGKVFSIEQATDGFRFDFRPGVIKRFNRQRVMKAQCDPGRGVNTMQLFAALRDSVDRAVVLPEGYSMKVFGEQESQQESNEALAEYMPLTLVLILIVLLLLFRNYREPVVILLMIPLIFIGVVLGLAVTGKVFNFFSLLGLLGLVGMNIKNAVVLVEQIGVLRAAGKDPYEALTSATRSRIVPVAMASGTTILGMLPLLFDSMFGAMAATIMGGLLVATLLTVWCPAGRLRHFLQYPQSHEDNSFDNRPLVLPPGAWADHARRLPPRCRRIQLVLKIAAAGERCRCRDGGRPHGLLAAVVDGRELYGDRAPFRRRGTLDVQPPAAAGADRLRRRCGAGRGPAGRTGATASRCATRSFRASTCAMPPTTPTGTSRPWNSMPPRCGSMSRSSVRSRRSSTAAFRRVISPRATC